MSWLHKISQQQLLFYPYSKPYAEVTQKVPPVSVDPKTKENIYKCHQCDQLITENETNWDVDKTKSESLQLSPNYANRLSQAYQEIAQYLLPFYNKLQEDIAKDDDFYLRSWEVQIPDLPIIVTKYPELKDFCSMDYYYGNTFCRLILDDIMEISGDKLTKLEDFILNPQAAAAEMEELVKQPFSIPYKMPICNKCLDKYKKCVNCQKPIISETRAWQTTWDDDEYVCEECIERGYADICSNCGKAESLDDIHNVHDEQLCEKCYKNVSSESIDWAEKSLAALDIPTGKNDPLSIKTINNINDFLDRYYKKYGNVEMNNKEWDRLIYLAQKSKISKDAIDYLSLNQDKDLQLQDLINKVNNNLKAHKYIQEKYPRISSFNDFPFDMAIEKNYNNDLPGFTITITPSDDFFNYAEKIYPDVRKTWEFMSNTPHHPNSLAYARCAYDGGDNLVINNLQRDADYDNYESKTSYYNKNTYTSAETAKWLDSSTKHWNVILLDIIKTIAISNNINAYLTSFDQQKKKWYSLPIHKSKKTYEQIPQMMNFPLTEDYETNLIEERGSDMYGELMYQVANDIGWFKKIKC